MARLVSVYRNLKYGRQARPLYSLLVDGRVRYRRHRVLLSGVRFRVYKGGWARAVRTGQKNVHAFVQGCVAGPRGCYGIDKDGRDFPVRLRYDVTKGMFVDPQGRQVVAAGAALLNENGLTACYLEYAT